MPGLLSGALSQAKISGKLCRQICRPSSNFKSLGPMTAHHEKLPHQPLPPLGTTLEKYLRAVHPLVTEEEFRRTQKIVEEFGAKGGLGHKLHAVLQERAKTLDNWMGDWWTRKDFMEVRAPIIPYGNVGGFWAKEEFSSRYDWLRYTSKFILALVDYKKHIDLHLLQPDMLYNEPMDMSQYFRIFSTCRIPKKECDDMIIYSESDNPPKHIVVVRNNQFFQVEVYDSKGEPLHASVIYSQLKKVVEEATIVALPVGILTAQERDTWAEAYERLQQDDLNKKTLEAIQSSMFIICLDRPTKHTNKEEPIPDYALNTICGGGSRHNGGNRWFDKCLEYIVSEDGVVGKCIEHSPLEGFTIVKGIDHVVEYMKKDVDWNESSFSLEPKKLEFNISKESCKDIESAEENFNKMVSNIDLGYLMYNKFGKSFMKENRFSPDSFAQMALSLAFYRLHGLRGVLYQVATMHRYLHGRMEIVHPSSTETINFCKTMLDENANLREKAASLRTAAAAHKSSVEEAHRGEGLDNLLLGLKCAALELGLKIPKLYKDYGYRACYNYRVITSQLPMRTSTVTTFGPLSEDGYGCPYHLYEDKLQFAVLSLRHRPETNSSNFVEAIGLSLTEMEEVVKSTGDMTVTCDF